MVTTGVQLDQDRVVIPENAVASIAALRVLDRAVKE